MIRFSTAFIHAALCLSSVVAAAEQGMPTNQQCQQMIDGMLQTMKSTPLQSEKDKRDVKDLLARIEKMIKDNQSNGKSSCDSWAEMSKILAHQ